MISQALVEEFGRNGFACLSPFLNEKTTTGLAEFTETLAGTNARNLLHDYQEIREFVAGERTMEVARALLGSDARAVKATFFDKTPEANWKVPAHQDVTIAVKMRSDAPGFGPWTMKGGVPNVQPPAEVLERMVAFRFHLDECTEDNGALKVWPGSHRLGKLGDGRIAEWVENHAPEICPVAAGGLMLMKPLVIHASSVSEKPFHRRVIHVEYAGCDLPDGLCWLNEIC